MKNERKQMWKWPQPILRHYPCISHNRETERQRERERERQTERERDRQTERERESQNSECLGQI